MNQGKGECGQVLRFKKNEFYFAFKYLQNCSYFAAGNFNSENYFYIRFQTFFFTVSSCIFFFKKLAQAWFQEEAEIHIDILKMNGWVKHNKISIYFFKNDLCH